jgi:chromate transporter
MNKASLGELFGLFFKIGAFTFGGGYAMIALISKETVEKRQWLTDNEFLDLVAIAESTPGPIAINSATYIGYKMHGFLGALVSTLGVVLPSFAIIVAISFFIEQFRQLEFVGYAFNGIAACVAVLILNAVFKLTKSMEKTGVAVLLVGIAFVLIFFQWVSTTLIILGGGLVGLIWYLLTRKKAGDPK